MQFPIPIIVWKTAIFLLIFHGNSFGGTILFQDFLKIVSSLQEDSMTIQTYNYQPQSIFTVAQVQVSFSLTRAQLYQLKEARLEKCLRKLMRSL